MTFSVVSARRQWHQSV